MASPFLASDGAVEVRIDSMGGLPGPWRRRTGGARTSEPIKIRPGHRLPEEARAGIPTTENVIVGTNFKLDVWTAGSNPLIGQLDAALDRAERGSVTQLWLDQRGNVFSRRTYTGVISAVRVPDYDTTTDDSGDLEIEFVMDAAVST
jgi:hypothetical protein